MAKIIAERRFQYKNRYPYVAYLKKQRDGTFTVNVGSVQDSGSDTWWVLPVSNQKNALKYLSIIARGYASSTSAETDEKLHYELNDMGIQDEDVSQHKDWD